MGTNQRMGSKREKCMGKIKRMGQRGPLMYFAGASQFESCSRVLPDLYRFLSLLQRYHGMVYAPLVTLGVFVCGSQVPGIYGHHAQ